MQDNFFETNGTPIESTFPAEQNRQNILSLILSLPLTPNQKRIAESKVNYALGEFPDNARAAYLLAKQKCYGLNEEEFQELEPNCFFPEEAQQLQRFIRERIIIEINGSEIEIVNRSSDPNITLDEEHLNLIKKTLEKVHQKIPALINRLLKIFILTQIGVEDQEYAPNGKITQRQCDTGPTGIVLTQQGYRTDIFHRIQEISNLEGTVVHELGHFIQKYYPEFENKWYEVLNYQSLSFDKEESNPPGWVKTKEGRRDVFVHKETGIKSYSGVVPQDPKKLPTHYAGFYPVEDIADSFVAYVFDKPLDSQRKKLFDDFFNEV